MAYSNFFIWAGKQGNFSLQKFRNEIESRISSTNVGPTFIFDRLNTDHYLTLSSSIDSKFHAIHRYILVEIEKKLSINHIGSSEKKWKLIFLKREYKFSPLRNTSKNILKVTLAEIAISCLNGVDKNWWILKATYKLEMMPTMLTISVLISGQATRAYPLHILFIHCIYCSCLWSANRLSYTELWLAVHKKV